MSRRHAWRLAPRRAGCSRAGGAARARSPATSAAGTRASERGDERFRSRPGPTTSGSPSAAAVRRRWRARCSGSTTTSSCARRRSSSGAAAPRAGSLRTSKQLAYATQAQVALAAIQVGDGPRRAALEGCERDRRARDGRRALELRRRLRALREGAAEVHRGVRLDPGNEAARHNLELALDAPARRRRAHRSRERQRRRRTRSGAGAGSGGSGF